MQLLSHRVQVCKTFQRLCPTQALHLNNSLVLIPEKQPTIFKSLFCILTSMSEINITILNSFRVTRCTKHKQSKQYYEYWKEIFTKIYFLQVLEQKTFRNSGFYRFFRHHFQIPSYFRFSRFFRLSGNPEISCNFHLKLVSTIFYQIFVF